MKCPVPWSLRRRDDNEGGLVTQWNRPSDLLLRHGIIYDGKGRGWEERPEVGLWALFPCRLTGTSQIRL